jgi:hypothetical protein
MATAQHRYQACRDRDCERTACTAWREAYEEGFAEGFAAGAAAAGES